MKIRLGNNRDIDNWMLLVDKVKSVFPGLDTERKLKAHRKTVIEFIARGEALCAEIDGSLAGILLFSKEMNKLCFLAVDSSFRRQHVADKLVKSMFSYLDLAKAITLETHPEGISEGFAAREFYKKLGFVAGAIKEEFGSPVQEFVLPGLKRELHIGDIVKHFKRETIDNPATEYLYKIIAFAHHSETDEMLVVYEALYPPFKTCARPYDMFMSEVDREKYPEIKQKYRFEVVQKGDKVTE